MGVNKCLRMVGRLKDLSKALELYLDNAQTYYLQGISYLEIGEREKARLAFERTLELD